MCRLSLRSVQVAHRPLIYMYSSSQASPGLTTYDHPPAVLRSVEWGSPLLVTMSSPTEKGFVNFFILRT